MLLPFYAFLFVVERCSQLIENDYDNNCRDCDSTRLLIVEDDSEQHKRRRLKRADAAMTGRKETTILDQYRDYHYHIIILTPNTATESNLKWRWQCQKRRATVHDWLRFHSDDDNENYANLWMSMDLTNMRQWYIGILYIHIGLPLQQQGLASYTHDSKRITDGERQVLISSLRIAVYKNRFENKWGRHKSKSKEYIS